MKAPTPVITKAVAKLLAQVQAEAQAATLEALSAKDGIAVLQDVDRATAHLYEYLDGDFDLRDALGYRLRMRRERFESQCWRSNKWRPGLWYVSEVRVDRQGNKWTRDVGAFITDDFGTLVSVEGGAA